MLTEFRDIGGLLQTLQTMMLWLQKNQAEKLVRNWEKFSQEMWFSLQTSVEKSLLQCLLEIIANSYLFAILCVKLPTEEVYLAKYAKSSLSNYTNMSVDCKFNDTSCT